MDRRPRRRLAVSADLVLELGSSLAVYPAAAAQAGAAAVIVNREPTPLDSQAAHMLHGPEELLPALVPA